MRCFLGADVGSTKIQILVCDEDGRLLGTGRSGSGNHQLVGYDGMFSALGEAASQALSEAEVGIQEIRAGGFGISGYDWPSDRPSIEAVLDRLGMPAARQVYNDAVLGLAAGAQGGWGVSVVSGTGCCCWGWDRERKRIGRVTGFGTLMGEAAGGSELVFHAMQLVGYDWTRRGEHTALSQAFAAYTGAASIEDLLEGYTTGRYQIDSQAAPLVFQVADAGDSVARQLILWAGSELGELANAVIRQLDFQSLAFDIVLMGSMFQGGTMLVDAMRAAVHAVAPGAHLVRLKDPPVVGAVIIAMQAAGLEVTPEARQRLSSDSRVRLMK